MTIDNLDGRGAFDYSDQVAPEGPITIERTLNKPSRCTFMLLAGGPARLGRVVVSSDDGMVLFTGYLPREAEARYAGADERGVIYRWSFEATSDEWLLDKQLVRVGGDSFGQSADALLGSLTARVGGSRFQTAAAGASLQVNHFVTKPNSRWSENASAIARAAAASYRVLAGEVQVVRLGTISHAFADADGTLTEAGLHMVTARDLVNDVTISGAIEAGTAVTEVFVGDGATADFQLSATPYSVGSARNAVIVSDDFGAAQVDTQRWVLQDAGSHVMLGAGGLTLTGGEGLDGTTTLAAVSSAELGGVLLLEASAVVLGQGSDGVLLGLYSGATRRSNCIAGFDVRQSGATTTVGCLLDGAIVGASFPVQPGHHYDLRMYLHAVEVRRERQTFPVVVAGKIRQFGGGLIESPLEVVFEVRDLGFASNTPGEVLYSGRIERSPASANFVPVNSVQLAGTIRSISGRRVTPVWVQSQPTQGGRVPRRAGNVGRGADYAMAGRGTLRFYPGRIPSAGEQVIVQYRQGQRSLARVQSAASIAGEMRGDLPGLASWRGSVLEPLPESAEDCEAAAEAVLAVASSRAEAIKGSYEAVYLTAEGANLVPVWPGDLLTFASALDQVIAVARRVLLVDDGSVPECVRARIEFANDWADSATLRLSDAFAADAAIPEIASSEPRPQSLSGLTVVSVTQSAIEIDTGTQPPAGGGFEVRRFDGGFGTGEDGELVLRSAMQGITLSRGAQVERFYVRQYDGSTPPVYSRLSSAVVVNVPVG